MKIISKHPFCKVLLILLFLVSNPVFSQEKIQLGNREDYKAAITSYFQKENWDAGKVILDEALQKYPKDSDLRMLLGKFYYAQKKYDQARYELLKSLEYYKDNFQAKSLLVNVEMATRRYSSAICYINELLEVSPYNKNLWLKKIDAYRLMGNIERANQLLKRILIIYPNDEGLRQSYLFIMENDAESKIKNGQFREAIDLIASLSEENPQDERLHLDLIDAYLRTGDRERALISTERGLHNLPGNITFVNKKIDILGSLHRYSEALEFIQLQMKNSNNKSFLQKRYNDLLEESARYHRNLEPYELYGKVFSQNPRNEEAFNYFVSRAMADGAYDEALGAIRRVKTIRGEQKDLLVRERLVYERMGEESKVDQLTVRLHDLYPDDRDIADQYTLYQYKKAKLYMQDEQYDKALDYWNYVLEHGDEEQQKSASIALYNSYFLSGNLDYSITALVRLIKRYPDEWEWRSKKAAVYQKQQKYPEAIAEYDSLLIVAPPSDMNRISGGYDELLTEYVKRLIEDYRLTEAMQVVEHWLNAIPPSEPAIRYAINISLQMKDYPAARRYALMNLAHRPNDIYSITKLAESYAVENDPKQAFDLLSPIVRKNTFHKELIHAYSSAGENYAKDLIKSADYKESLSVLDSALFYNPESKSLKYWKGVAYEKIRSYDSAYYYQSFYEPSLMEKDEFARHLTYLKNKTYPNQVAFSYLRSQYENEPELTSMFTVEYTRFNRKNVYTGRINYTGRKDGKGYQGQLEWNHTWRPDIYTRMDVLLGSRYFPVLVATGSVFKAFKNEWEAEAGLGYRRTRDKGNYLNLAGGISKGEGSWWVNARANTFVMNSQWYYNLSSQARFYFNTPKSYFTALASFGTAPDPDVLDHQLYNGVFFRNTMVGLGINHLFTKQFSAGIVGTWYNYENAPNHYRDLYNLYLQFYVNF